MVRALSFCTVLAAIHRGPCARRSGARRNGSAARVECDPPPMPCAPRPYALRVITQNVGT